MRKYIYTFLIMVMSSMTSQAQTENTAADIIDFRVVDGKIIVTAMVNGKMGDFALDLTGHSTIMESQMANFNIDPTAKTKIIGAEFRYRNYTALSTVVVESVSVGNIASVMQANFYVIADEPYLKELGVVGTINTMFFSRYVFTLDTQRKKITLTAPYRPPYMKLDYRADGNFESGKIMSFNVMVDNVPCKVMLDTWNQAALSLTPDDFAALSHGKKAAVDGVSGSGFEKSEKALKQFKASSVGLVKSEIKDVTVVENKSLKVSTVGLDFMKQGIVSMDFGKTKIYFQPHGLVAIDDAAILPEEITIVDGKLNAISAKFFKEKIFDYTKGGEFKSKTDKVYVVDFWAKWCGPCMKMMPQMEALAKKYEGKVVFCKVDADKEKELCNAYSVQALPTLFFIVPGGKPVIEVGATVEKFEAMIDELLKK